MHHSGSPNALAGNAPIDGAWREALIDIQTIVATSENDIVGTAAYDGRKADNSPFADCRFILWLHARKKQEVTEALLSSLLATLQR